MQPTLCTNLAKRIPAPLYKWLARRWIDYSFPRHLYIELTQKCQLSCESCPRPIANGDMDYEMFERIIAEASAYGKRSISLHLFGEPLLYKDILRAIRFLKDQRHSVILTTNGILLDRFAEQLMELHIDKIIWTYRPWVNFNAQSKKLLKKIGIIRFLGDAKEKAKEWKGYKKEIKEYHNYGGYKDYKLDIKKRYPCYHLWLAPGIRWNGDFTACCNDSDGFLVIGNIQKHSINSLWNSKTMQDMRKEQFRGFYRSICDKCNCWATYRSIW